MKVRGIEGGLVAVATQLNRPDDLMTLSKGASNSNTPYSSNVTKLSLSCQPRNQRLTSMALITTSRMPRKFLQR